MPARQARPEVAGRGGGRADQGNDEEVMKDA